MAASPEMVAERKMEWRAWVAPLVAVVVLVAGLSVVIVLSNRSSGTDAPPPIAPFVIPAPANPIIAYDVGEVQSDKVRLDISGGSAAPASATIRELSLTGNTRWEFLQPATIADIKAGDRIQVIGVPNSVRSFHIRSVVIIPAEGATADADGFIRSAGGFAGNEASRVNSERPILGGVVDTVSGDTVTIKGPTSTITISLIEGAALRRIVAAPGTTIADGDRVAFVPTEGQPPNVLVLPGGAKK